MKPWATDLQQKILSGTLLKGKPSFYKGAPFYVKMLLWGVDFQKKYNEQKVALETVSNLYSQNTSTAEATLLKFAILHNTIVSVRSGKFEFDWTRDKYLRAVNKLKIELQEHPQLRPSLGFLMLLVSDYLEANLDLDEAQQWRTNGLTVLNELNNTDIHLHRLSFMGTYNLANLLNRQGLFCEAIAQYNKALVFIKDDPRSTQLDKNLLTLITFRSYLQLAYCTDHSAPEKIKHGHNALITFDLLSQNIQTALALELALAKLHLGLAHLYQKNEKEARKLTTQVKEHMEVESTRLNNIESLSDYIVLQTGLAQLYEKLSEHQAALECLEVALDLSEKIPDSASKALGMAKSLRVKSNILVELNHLDMAVSTIKQSTDILRKKEKEYPGRFRARLNKNLLDISAVWAKLGNQETALSLAQEVYFSLPDDNSLSEVRLKSIENIALYQKQLNGIESTNRWYLELEKLLDSNKSLYMYDQNSLAKSYYNLAQWKVSLSQFEKALLYLNMALKIRSKNKGISKHHNFRGIAAIYSSLGDLHSKQHEMERSIEFHLKAIDLVENTDILSERFDVIRAPSFGSYTALINHHLQDGAIEQTFDFCLRKRAASNKDLGAYIIDVLSDDFAFLTLDVLNQHESLVHIANSENLERVIITLDGYKTQSQALEKQIVDLCKSLGDTKYLLISPDSTWSQFPLELWLKQEDVTLIRLTNVSHAAIEKLNRLRVEYTFREFCIANAGNIDPKLSNAETEAQNVFTKLKSSGKRKAYSFENGTCTSSELLEAFSSDVEYFHFIGHGESKLGEEYLCVNSDQGNDIHYFGNKDLNKKFGYLKGAGDSLGNLSNRVILLNCCYAGETRSNSGNRLDLTATLVKIGSLAVIANANPVHDRIAAAFGEEFCFGICEGRSIVESFKIAQSKCHEMEQDSPNAAFFQLHI